MERYKIEFQDHLGQMGKQANQANPVNLVHQEVATIAHQLVSLLDIKIKNYNYYIINNYIS